MSMSVKMKSSYDKMMLKSKDLEATTLNQNIHIITEGGSSFVIYNVYIENHSPYLWVFCEHSTDLIFHMNELFHYRTFS